MCTFITTIYSNPKPNYISVFFFNRYDIIADIVTISANFRMAMQTDMIIELPLQSEEETISPADVVKIELTLDHSFVGKRQILFQWYCNVAITAGEFELVRLQPYELLYKGTQFDCTVEYTSRFLGLQSSYKIILREGGVLAESPITLIDIPPEVPNQPSPPKFQLSSKTTAFVRWNAVEKNGANIIAYHLECLMPDTTIYKLVYSGIERNIKVPIKFQSDSEYNFRLKAVNSVGNSPYSSILKYLTSPGKL